MLVARYKNNADGKLRIKKRRILIRLDQKNNPLFEKAVFLTVNDFKNSIDAKEYLSMTYAPTNKFFYDIPQRSLCGILYNNLGEPFSDSLRKRDDDRTYLTRTWPAFGHAGGGFEIILSNLASGETQSIEECEYEQIFDTSMKEPFINDIYHQDYITELDESRAEAATRHGSMTAKITVYDSNGKVVDVRIVRGQEEILRLLDRDISPVFT